jgi:hypothetical protein
MSPQLERMRELLEAEDVGGFLSAYAEYLASGLQEPAATNITQRLLPPVLLRCLQAERLPAPALVQLYRMVLTGRLLLVENDVLHAINLRVDAAIHQVEPAVPRPVAPLRTFRDDPASDRPPQEPVRKPPDGDVMRVRRVSRVAVVSAFSFETWAVSDAFDFRKNMCASRQESEFLQAVRQFLPNLHAYPNVPLRNFIDVDKLEDRLPLKVRNFAWTSQVDVLLCTREEDPVAGIELDSVHHDSEEAAERDAQKNNLFRLAGVPLVRIRADDVKAVRAEDFYDLLVSQTSELEVLRPRRMRPRRTYDSLAPAEVVARTTAR